MTEENFSVDGNIAPRPLSRLSYQIMGLNLIALIVLVAGIFYLDQYKRDLTTSETEILATEAQLYASLLSDNAFHNGAVDMNEAKKLLNTFGAQKTQRLRLFDAGGALAYDTNTPDRATGTPLHKIIPRTEGTVFEKSFDFIARLLSVTFALPSYPEIKNQTAAAYPDAGDALAGSVSLSAWQANDGGLVLSTAVPIKKNNQPIAVLLVTRADTKIEKTFSRMRIGIAQFFFGSLLITLCFSLYLSASIGHPLRRLATAAEAVRLNRAGVEIIPDWSFRKDEIGELSLALRDMTEALQERIESIERFAADVAHELKNPLTSMRSAFETLEKVHREEDRKKLHGIILHDLIRMDRLISDISHASRLDVELQRDVLSPVDLRQVIFPLIDAYRKPLERAGQHEESSDNILCEGLAKPVIIEGHAARLAQVFQNLIGNALSFTRANKPVRISVQQGAEFVTVTVDDEGPGIPENKLEQVFERFYTERPGTEAFGSHSGLGLSIARQIVAAHDGKISASNRLDEEGKVLGARFTVKLRPA